MDLGLTKKNFLITGASGGIGSSCAHEFAAEGANLALHYHSNHSAAEELAENISTETCVVGGDLGQETDVDRVYSQIESSLGELDGIVVNAGIWCVDKVPVHEMSLAQWQQTLETNLTGAFLTCRGFLRQLARKPRETGSIVLIASTAGLFGEEGHCDYSASKAAMAHGMTASLKNEIVRLAPRGRVNCVCPGWVLTPMAERSLADPEVLATATATIAMGKVAQPEDVARAVLYLSSEKASGHVSGNILPVSGGMEGRLLHP
ncbi:MAG: SDR family NAD(P)-dependent oxidoreductase [Planctomycetota bacterium]|jgi:3-oxoacyl-[acyl-carrier protein] reductase